MAGLAPAIHGEAPLGEFNQCRFARLDEELSYKAHRAGACAPEFPIGTQARKLNGLINEWAKWVNWRGELCEPGNSENGLAALAPPK